QGFLYAGVEGVGGVRAPLPDVIASVEAFGRRLTAWGDVKEGGEAPARTRMLPNYPSPFNPETWIPYELAAAANVVIEVVDSRGAVIRRLAVGVREAGRYVGRGRAAHWDGRNDVGELASGGVYYVTLRAGATVVTRRIVLSK
ncbi:MAG: FlgD immunoglobulin-like domain containing protein, partial [Candidatus Poribacteria bacterium]